MDKVGLKIASLSKKLKELKEKTFELLESNQSLDLKAELIKELDELKTRDKVKIAFVGQYSSGKSTIISALTGNKDIKIDADVATDKVTEYEWNNIILMDTPGILAGKTEKHDEATKAALSQCDLIVYVLTSNLFDDVIFNNFIDLAYEQKLSDKMLIAINKMSMEDGEFEQLTQSYTESINTTFRQKGLNFDFPVVFIDAADYIEGVDSNDDEFIEISNFNKFIETLNVFVEEKGLIKKEFDTPIRLLQKYLSNLAVSEVDSGLITYFQQCSNRVNQSKREIKTTVENIVDRFESESLNNVYPVADRMLQMNQDEFNREQEGYIRDLDKNVVKLLEQIDSEINDNYESLSKDIEELKNRDSIKLFRENLLKKIESADITYEERENYKKQLGFADILKTGGSKLSELASGTGSVTLSGIRFASGSSLHEGVKFVGHMLGHSFKPWEAIHIAANIGKFASVGLPVLAGGVQLWFAFKDKKKEEERQEQLKNCRRQFVDHYRKVIRQKCDAIMKYFKDSVLSNYNQITKEFDDNKIEIANLTSKNSKMMENIKKMSVEYNDFIEIIES